MRLLLAAAAALASAPALSSQPIPKNERAEIEIAGPVLMVTDLERSLKFYVDGLGLQATRLPANPGPGVIVVAPGRGPTPFLLIRQSGPDPSAAAPISHGNAFSVSRVSACASPPDQPRPCSHCQTTVPTRSSCSPSTTSGRSPHEW